MIEKSFSSLKFQVSSFKEGRRESEGRGLSIGFMFQVVLLCVCMWFVGVLLFSVFCLFLFFFFCSKVMSITFVFSPRSDGSDGKSD